MHYSVYVCCVSVKSGAVNHIACDVAELIKGTICSLFNLESSLVTEQLSVINATYTV